MIKHINVLDLHKNLSAVKQKIERRKYTVMRNNHDSDLHECVGHGFGLLLPGVKQEELEVYYSCLKDT
jgi:hypothetical protein